MENIDYCLIINGNDFKEIKNLSKLLYFSLKQEKFNVSLLIKNASNISNFSAAEALIKVGGFTSLSCSYNINAIITLDFQSLLNYIPYINKNTIILSDFSSFNACNYFLADNKTVNEKLLEKTENIYKIPTEELANIDGMGKAKTTPYGVLVGAFIAKSGLIDIDSICGGIAALSKNDQEKENSIKTLLAGYDYAE